MSKQITYSKLSDAKTTFEHPIHKSQKHFRHVAVLHNGRKVSEGMIHTGDSNLILTKNIDKEVTWNKGVKITDSQVMLVVQRHNLKKFTTAILHKIKMV
jgi:hypothetical protein